MRQSFLTQANVSMINSLMRNVFDHHDGEVPKFTLNSLTFPQLFVFGACLLELVNRLRFWNELVALLSTWVVVPA